MSANLEYTPSGNATSEQLVEQHLALVKRIAYHLVSRLPPNVDVDDLIQAGMLGLLEAAGKYSKGAGASFETFASIRIRGAMLDEVRKADWTPRSVYRKARRVEEAIREIEHENGREASASEITTLLGISMEEYHSVLQDSASSRLLPLEYGGDEDGFSVGHKDPNASDPCDELESDAFKKALTNEIAQLPERERLVMSLYYVEELNLKEAGAVLDVSESRVCQIHGQALARLRSRLRNWRENSEGELD